jgi:hypothetical protein
MEAGAQELREIGAVIHDEGRFKAVAVGRDIACLQVRGSRPMRLVAELEDFRSGRKPCFRDSRPVRAAALLEGCGVEDRV